MKLLDLHPKIREYIKSLSGTPERMVSERGLRALVDHPEQIRVALVSVKGFRAFVDSTNEQFCCAPCRAA